MRVDADYYQGLLDANGTAFSQHLFKVAYHMLAAALHCAIYLEDDEKVVQVEQIAREQRYALEQRFQALSFEKQPCEVGLYRVLTQIAQSRHVLLTAPLR